MRYIFNNHTKKALGWMIVSLMIGASSTVWFSGLLNGSGSPFLFLGLLIGSFILNSIPDTFAVTEFERAEFESVKEYVHDFSTEYQNLPELTLDKELRTKQEPWLVSEARQVMRTAQSVIYNSVSCVLPFVVDAITMSVVIDPLYVGGYIGSAVVYAAISKPFNKKVKTLSLIALDNDKSLSAALIAGWNNIITGNLYNLNLWKLRFLEKFNLTKETSVNYSRYAKVSSSFVTIIASLPILGVTIYLFQQNIGNPPKLALLSAVLPRQLLVIQQLYILSNTFAQWAGVQEKMKALLDSIKEPFKDHNEPSYKLYWQKLRFSSNSHPVLKFDSMSDFFSAVLKMKQARITIRGDNGAGKSVLMCRLNKFLTEQRETTFYLPVNSGLTFESPTDRMSSGEKMKAELQEITKNTYCNFLLLDEWDSNLDFENIQVLSNLLNDIANKRCVIEIRHRTDEKIEKKEEMDTSNKEIVHRDLLDNFILVSFKQRQKLDIEPTLTLDPNLDSLQLSKSSNKLPLLKDYV